METLNEMKKRWAKETAARRKALYGEARKDFRAILNGTDTEHGSHDLAWIMNPRYKEWHTIGELCEQARLCGLRFTTETTLDRFEDLPRREQYLIMEYAVKDLQKAGRVDRCLGSDDGREVAVYKLMK